LTIGAINVKCAFGAALSGLALMCMLSGAALAQGDKPVPTGKKLVVATKLAPPFSYKGPDGSWIGVTIDLWSDIAHRLGMEYEFREYTDVASLLDAVTKGDADVGAAAITVTGAREEVMDFSHPYYFTGLGIAIPAEPSGNMFVRLLSQFLSPLFLGYIGALLALLLVVGGAVWLLERRVNAEHFKQGRKGIGDGVWWSAVTMTTVGYGDVAPKTFWGRVLGLFWMFASVILLSFFTAGITTSLTVGQLADKVQGPNDLPGARVGSVAESSSALYLTQAMHVSPLYFKSVEEGLAAVDAGRIDAFVYDRPILQYYVREKFSGKVNVIKAVFDPQTYGFAFPQAGNLRKPVNVELLEMMDDRAYRRELKARYLGQDDE
jgi:polar amino acid transport system substrate-binding protein